MMFKILNKNIWIYFLFLRWRPTMWEKNTCTWELMTITSFTLRYYCPNVSLILIFHSNTFCVFSPSPVHLDKIYYLLQKLQPVEQDLYLFWEGISPVVNTHLLYILKVRATATKTCPLFAGERVKSINATCTYDLHTRIPLDDKHTHCRSLCGNT